MSQWVCNDIKTSYNKQLATQKSFSCIVMEAGSDEIHQGACGGSNLASQQVACESGDNPSALPSLSVSETSNSSGHPPGATSPRGRQTRKAFAKCRPASKDLLDDYLYTKKEARRRSSCKEIILQLLRTDSGGEPQETQEPGFHLVERQRRLTIANKVLESFSESTESLPAPPPNPFGSLTDTLCAYDKELKEKCPLRYRSQSTEAYDSREVKVKVNETKAFLFDSNPELQDDLEEASYVTARRHRRGAVWHSETEKDVRKLLQKLKLNSERAKTREVGQSPLVGGKNKSINNGNDRPKPDSKKMRIDRKVKLGQLGRSFSVDVPD